MSQAVLAFPEKSQFIGDSESTTNYLFLCIFRDDTSGLESHPLNSPASHHKYSLYSPHWSFFIVDKNCNWNTGHGMGKEDGVKSCV